MFILKISVLTVFIYKLRLQHLLLVTINKRFSIDCYQAAAVSDAIALSLTLKYSKRSSSVLKQQSKNIVLAVYLSTSFLMQRLSLLKKRRHRLYTQPRQYLCKGPVKSLFKTQTSFGGSHHSGGRHSKNPLVILLPTCSVLHDIMIKSSKARNSLSKIVR